MLHGSSRSDLKESFKNNFNNLNKSEHTIVQLYGRFAIIFGSLIVGLINPYLFKDINLSDNLNLLYSRVYLIVMIILYYLFLELYYQN